MEDGKILTVDTVGIHKEKWIVGSFKDSGLSFASTPKVHYTEESAIAEAKRLTQQLRLKFIWVKIGGAVQASNFIFD